MAHCGCRGCTPGKQVAVRNACFHLNLPPPPPCRWCAASCSFPAFLFSLASCLSPPIQGCHTATDRSGATPCSDDAQWHSQNKMASGDARCWSCVCRWLRRWGQGSTCKKGTSHDAQCMQAPPVLSFFEQQKCMGITRNCIGRLGQGRAGAKAHVACTWICKASPCGAHGPVQRHERERKVAPTRRALLPCPVGWSVPLNGAWTETGWHSSG